MARLSKREAGTQNRLHEQLDFFGAKKKRFISVYANKPRIKIKHKSNNDKFKVEEGYSFAVQDPRLGLGLQQLQAQGGLNQLAQLQGVGCASTQSEALMGQCSFRNCFVGSSLSTSGFGIIF